MTSSPPARRFDWSNLGLRVLSAAILAPIAVLAVWFDGVVFFAVVAAAVGVLAREWAGMSAPHAPIRATALMTVAVLAALTAAYVDHFIIAWILLPVGALAAALFALARRMSDRPADEGFGVLYIGAPVVALFWLRSDAEGRGWTVLLLAVAWAADIAAFAIGSALKGPKLWPRFSPNKTWSGFIGGLVAAVIVAEVVVLLFPFQRAPHLPWLVGFVAGLATMAGDLWESMLKRRFGVKDSGGLIPGHGGLLDRVDGLMFAVLAMAGLRLLAQFGAGV